MSKDFKAMYHEINKDHFPKNVKISFDDGEKSQTLCYQKVEWNIAGELRGLRYGENPDQEAAMYKLVNGNLRLGEVESILPGNFLASDPELIQSGKHPGKINLTDIDSAIGILRYMDQQPCTVIVKHNNPSGVAMADSLHQSYEKAYYADRIAAFGGAIAVNRSLDIATAQLICAQYCEVVAAPEFEEGVLALFEKKKNLRVMRIGNMAKLANFDTSRFVDFKSLIDGGLVLQWSFSPIVRHPDQLFAAKASHQGKNYQVNREPTIQETEDMVFGWLVEAGVSSNSVLYVKDKVTVGIGTGEQDRVGVAEIARDKAYKKRADFYAWKKYNQALSQIVDQDQLAEIAGIVESENGGLKGSVMVSDAFFPFRDGVDVGLKEGVKAVVQPGGSLRDYEVIEACNEYGASMMFTGQRSFKH